jgi:CheY-like chemotaxis protein
MVHGLAAQLGGKLDLRSASGKGTTAEIWLPVADEAAQIEELEARPLVAAIERATILLVDDEELVRVGTADMLCDLGYEVLQASSGAEALGLLREGQQPDLLVTDYLMPGMNGVELVNQVRALRPEMKTLLITGYSNIAEGPGASLPRLAKPFRQADLAQHVADLLVPTSSDTVVQIRGERAK